MVKVQCSVDSILAHFPEFDSVVRLPLAGKRETKTIRDFGEEGPHGMRGRRGAARTRSMRDETKTVEQGKKNKGVGTDVF